MKIILYRGKPLSDHQHEWTQVQEIINHLHEYKIDGISEIHVIVNLPLPTTQLDLLLLTSQGMAIVELKNYQGKITGDQTNPWIVHTRDNKDVSIRRNVFKQIQNQRESLREVLHAISLNDNQFASHKIKIQGWAYFRPGSTFDIFQIHERHHKWFDVITQEQLVQKLRFLNAGYNLSHESLEQLLTNLKVTKVLKPSELLGIKKKVRIKSTFDERKAFNPFVDLFKPQETGDQAFDQKEYYKAVRLFAQEIELNPRNDLNWVKLVIALQRTGEADKAIKVAERGISYNPQNYDLQGLFGITLIERGREDEAKKHFEIMVKNNPNAYSTWFILGNALYKRGEYVKAIEALKRSLSFSSNAVASLRLLGHCSLHLNDSKQAYQAFNSILQMHPEDTGGLIGQATVFMQNKRYDEALDRLYHILEFQEDNALVWLLVAAAYRKKQDYQQALEAIRIALKLQPFEESILELQEKILEELDEKIESIN